MLQVRVLPCQPTCRRRPKVGHLVGIEKVWVRFPVMAPNMPRGGALPGNDLLTVGAGGANRGVVAQLGAHLPCKQRVTGSSPVFSTNAAVAKWSRQRVLSPKSAGSNPVGGTKSWPCGAAKSAAGFEPAGRGFESLRGRQCGGDVNGSIRGFQPCRAGSNPVRRTNTCPSRTTDVQPPPKRQVKVRVLRGEPIAWDVSSAVRMLACHASGHGFDPRTSRHPPVLAKRTRLPVFTRAIRGSNPLDRTSAAE